MDDNNISADSARTVKLDDRWVLLSDNPVEDDIQMRVREAGVDARDGMCPVGIIGDAKRATTFSVRQIMLCEQAFAEGIPSRLSSITPGEFDYIDQYAATLPATLLHETIHVMSADEDCRQIVAT